MLCLLALACRRDDAKTSFVRSLRCGMTREEVIRLAHRTGYKRLAAAPQNDRTLLDLTFHEGKLVSARVEHRTINLCQH
jgi:hypothetical protein